MKKTKKMVALALAASMVMGSLVTAFADETPAGTTGSGTLEGHVNREVVNMVLPTVANGSTPFAYTMDPERLIQDTEGAKYEDFTFPENTTESPDTGVYFLTGEKTYENSSNVLQAINKSSCPVTLTVKVKATEIDAAKDITLVTSPSTSTTAAELYLALKVGSTTQAVSKTETTITKTVGGTAGNFETTVKDKEGSTTGEKVYVYQEKADATNWKAINISMTGAVNNYQVSADTTAPTVDVTWSYAKAADTATVDTNDQVDYSGIPATSSAAAIVVPDEGNATALVTIGTDEAAPTELTTTAFEGNLFTITNGWGATYDASTKTITFDSGITGDLKSDDTMTFTLTFTKEDGTTYTQTLSCN